MSELSQQYHAGRMGGEWGGGGDGAQARRGVQMWLIGLLVGEGFKRGF